MPTYGAPLDLSLNELRNALLQQLASDPGSPTNGQIWINTTTDVVKVRIDGVTYTLASGSGLTQEQIEDLLGTGFLVAGNNIDLAYTDNGAGAGTLQIDVEALTEADITDLGTLALLKSVYNANTILIATTDNTPIPLTVGASTVVARLASGDIVAATPSQIKTLLATVAADISDFNTAVRTNRLDQMAAPTASVAMNSQKITGLLDGASAQDAVTLSQLQAVQQGIDWKQSVRAASTANVTVASALVNASSMDGVTLATGDRVLLKNQTTASENGVYIVAASGAASRAIDADSSADVTGGFAVWVNEGTTQGDSGWVLTTNDPITLGSTSLVFTQFSGLGQITAGNGLTKTGNTIDFVGGTGISVAADAVTIDTAVVVRKYAASFGDGSATTYNIDHNLGTLDVTVEVYRNSDGVKVECDVTHSTTNRVILGFTVAPTSNQYRVVVHG
jgi:hypothetical protein